MKNSVKKISFSIAKSCVAFQFKESEYMSFRDELRRYDLRAGMSKEHGSWVVFQHAKFEQTYTQISENDYVVIEHIPYDSKFVHFTVLSQIEFQNLNKI